MRRCLFCDNSANTREHAWPRWILEAFKPPVPFHRRSGKKLENRTNDYEPKIRMVCSACNRGWMSDLENRCRGIIGAMMSGASISLDKEAQFHLSRWAIKTSITLGCLVKEGKAACYTDEEREMLRFGTTLPAKSLVWMARYTDPDLLVSIGTAKTPAKDILDFDWCVANLAVGYLLLQVLNFHTLGDDTDTSSVLVPVDGPWEDGLIPISPSAGTVLWPPTVSFSDEGRFPVSALLNRFGGKLGW